MEKPAAMWYDAFLNLRRRAMTRNIIREMQREAARHLPPPPGFIIPGWFGAEWAIVGVVVVIAVIVACVFF